MRVERDVPIAALTTLRVGGPAREYVRAHDDDALVAAVRGADDAGVPVLLLAGGSNLLVGDDGFPGRVVHVATRGLCRDGDQLVVAAGHPWDEVVASAVDAGLAGIECLSGIPGSTGATPVQNVGAYGQEVGQTLVSVEALDRSAGRVVTLPAGELGLGYRTSRFRYADTHVVVSVRLVLRSAATAGPVRYAELADALGVDVGGRAPLAAVRETVLRLRRRKGMVLDPDDPDTVSAGSFFTNPVLSAAAFEELGRRAGERLGDDVAVPAWPEPDGRVKTSAAWLIEAAGFRRGHARGPVRLSGKHTLALTNPAGGSAADLVALAREVRDGVRDAFGVDLHPEPVLVGIEW